MGCLLFAILLVAIWAIVGVGPDLPLGFIVGAAAGMLIALLGTFNAGWNAHVDHAEARDIARAHENASRDRK